MGAGPIILSCRSCPLHQVHLPCDVSVPRARNCRHRDPPRAGGPGSAALQRPRVLHRQDTLAHISFVQEANRWFAEMARAHNFRYESTFDWKRLNAETAEYQVVAVSRHAARRSGAARGVQALHGAGRRVDGISFRWLRADAVGLPAGLGLVPQRVPRCGVVREQHVAADVRRCLRVEAPAVP